METITKETRKIGAIKKGGKNVGGSGGGNKKYYVG